MKAGLLRIAPLLLLGASAAPAPSQEFALHEGERVVFYGDSITAQRLYTRFVEDIVLTRYPQLHVTFWNAGVPGDTVYGGYTGDMPARVKRDLLAHQPTMVTIMLGMNDGYYMAFNEKYFDIYKEGYRKLLAAIEAGAPSARLMLVSPTPYDEVTHGTEFAEYNQSISHHASFTKELAEWSHTGFSDFNGAVSNLLKAGTAKNAQLAGLLIPDRIHPAEACHWVMAAELARSWGVSPVVSSVWIDAARQKPVAAENSAIAELSSKDGSLRWTQTDNALPLPLPLDDGMIQFVLGLSSLADLDRQMLRVEGLTASRYTVGIDGREVASFTREQLAVGVNLALYPTPMVSQAKGVDGIELKRSRLDEARFLTAIENPAALKKDDATRDLQAEDAALAEEQRKAAQPKPHHFELTPR